MQRAVGVCSAPAKPAFAKRPARCVMSRVLGVGTTAMAGFLPKRLEEGSGHDVTVDDRFGGKPSSARRPLRARPPTATPSR